MRAWGKRKEYKIDGLPYDFRSGYEAQIAADLIVKKVSFEYETVKLALTKPIVGAWCLECGSKKTAKKTTYKPDFIIPIKGTLAKCIVEAKGRMTAKDRKTILAFSAVAQTLDSFYFVLIQRDNKLSTGSTTRYSDWLRKNGITFAVGTTIPPAWYQETP